MERLTRRLSGGGIQLERNNGREIVGAGFMDCALVRAARERLAAYEDTGFTPEEIEKLKKELYLTGTYVSAPHGTPARALRGEMG